MGAFGDDNHQNYFLMIISLLQETEKSTVLWCAHSQMSCWLQMEQMYTEQQAHLFMTFYPTSPYG